MKKKKIKILAILAALVVLFVCVKIPSIVAADNLEDDEAVPMEIFSINIDSYRGGWIMAGDPVTISVVTSANVETIFWHLKDQQITSAPIASTPSEFYEKDGKRYFSVHEAFDVFTDSLYIIAQDKDGKEIEELYGIFDTRYISRIAQPGYSYIGTQTAVHVWTKGVVSSVAIYDAEDNEVCRTSDYRQTFRYSLYVPVTEAGSKTYKVVASYVGGISDDVQYFTIDAVEPDWKSVKPDENQIFFEFYGGCHADLDKEYEFGDLLSVTYSLVGKLDNIVVLDSFGDEIVSITDVPMPLDYVAYLYGVVYYQTEGTVEFELLLSGEQEYTIIFTDVNGEVIEEVINVTVLPDETDPEPDPDDQEPEPDPDTSCQPKSCRHSKKCHAGTVTNGKGSHQNQFKYGYSNQNNKNHNNQKPQYKISTPSKNHHGKR